MLKKEKHGLTNVDRRNLIKVALSGLFVGILAPAVGRINPSHAATGGRILIIYYSRTGNTRALAKQIQEMSGGDILELETVRPYPSDYSSITEQAKQELKSGYLPDLKTSIGNLDSYSTIWVGSPCWWGTMAPPVRTFLSQQNLSGKTVAPFMTHEGSGLGNTVSDLKKYCKNSTIVDGLAVRGSSARSAKSEVSAWLKELGLVS